MFDILCSERQEFECRYNYKKIFDFKVEDEDGDKVSVYLCVYDVNIGYNVYTNFTGKLQCLKWFRKNEDAIEYAVKKAQEIKAEHDDSTSSFNDDEDL